MPADATLLARGGSVGCAYAFGRRSVKPALGSVERAPVGPVVAVYRRTVSSVFHKDGSDAVYAVHGAVTKGRWEGEKRGKEVSVLDASCPTMPK
jgi:hypothetical protein